MVSLGSTSAGLVMREYFQPRLVEFSQLLDRSQAGLHDPNRKSPLPEDWSTALGMGQLTPPVDSPAALRFKLDYGYFSSIKVTDSYDTGIPFCATAIIRLPFGYGTTPGEAQNSWFFPRKRFRILRPLTSLRSPDSYRYADFRPAFQILEELRDISTGGMGAQGRFGLEAFPLVFPNIDN